MPRAHWERSGQRLGEADERDSTAPARPRTPPEAVLALQAGAGNAAAARVIQRMTFARFHRFGPLSNWGSYDPTEQGLLKNENDLAAYIAKLEGWAVADAQIQQLLAQFTTLQQGRYPQTQYTGVQANMTQIENGLRTRRAELLNQNPSRIDKDPVFQNHLPDALVGEIQQFLGRAKIDPSAFRLAIPVPGEHAPTEQAFKDADKDEHLAKALTDSLHQRLDTLHEKLVKEGELLWVYSTDGLLSVGSKDENKHSVTGAGADVWAAGTVRVKLTEAETTYGRYMSDLQKAAFYKQRMIDLENDKSIPEDTKKTKLREIRENLSYQESEAARDKEAYESMGFKPEDAPKIGKVVVVDFDSGHYQPHEAWRRTASAWGKLGYKVEFNPHGRTA